MPKGALYTFDAKLAIDQGRFESMEDESEVQEVVLENVELTYREKGDSTDPSQSGTGHARRIRMILFIDWK